MDYNFLKIKEVFCSRPELMKDNSSEMSKISKSRITESNISFGVNRTTYRPETTNSINEIVDVIRQRHNLDEMDNGRNTSKCSAQIKQSGIVKQTRNTFKNDQVEFKIPTNSNAQNQSGSGKIYQTKTSHNNTQITMPSKYMTMTEGRDYTRNRLYQ